MGGEEEPPRVGAEVALRRGEAGAPGLGAE